MDPSSDPSDHEYSIKSHGIIGDTYSSALVTIRGTIDWCTFPRMDSPAVFSSLLDREKGGESKIVLEGANKFSQVYRKDTNVLETTIKSDKCVITLTDFMPVEEVRGLVYSRHEIHRVIKCIKGNGEVTVTVTPKFNFGRDATDIHSAKNGCTASSDGDSLTVLSRFRLQVRGDSASCTFSVRAGMRIPFVLRWNGREPREPKMEWVDQLLKRTILFWRNWARKTQYRGQWRDAVMRSALVLKLLTYTPTGAIVAAPTTSLPESAGHGRNWDYRFSWVRDSTYALWSFHLLGHEEEERKYLQWLLRLLKGRSSKPEALRVMYTVEGDPVPAESEVFGFSGYLNSRPVREGNSATDQSQMDIYGSVIDAIHFTFHKPEFLPDQLWRVVDGLATYVKKKWQEPDAGIWEMRNGYQRHTHSAVMSWLALWRASEMAGWIGSERRRLEWAKTARMIKKDIMKKGFSQELSAFTSRMDGGYLDASILMMPLVRFISAGNPKFRSTVRSIEENLTEDGLLYRYLMDDGIDGKEGVFIACTFWYVIVLLLQNRVERAIETFESLLKRSNHLGLLSEEMDPKTGDFLGNFPQAFSHMGLINAAWYLNSHQKRLMH